VLIRTWAKSRSTFSRVGARKGIQLMEINRTTIYPDVILRPGNRPILSQRGKEDVVLYKVYALVWLNVYDDDDLKNKILVFFNDLINIIFIQTFRS